MLSWSARKRLTYFIAVAAFLLVIVSVPAYFFFNRPGNCFDGKENNGEDGVDCGGACAHLCEFQASDIITRWSRIVKVRDGVYDAVALIENPNFNAGISNIKYIFKFYDIKTSLVAERRGSTFVNPNEQFVIFEPSINTGSLIPTRTSFSFEEVPYWIRAGSAKPDLLVKNKVVEGIETKPRLRASIINQSLDNLGKVLVTGLLLNRSENVVAVSQTVAENIPPNGSRDVVFTWPAPFAEKPEVCVNPLDVMMAFDRSGSMNDDGGIPPQPLHDARIAAATFLDKLGGSDQVGLITFATNASDPIDQELSKDQPKVKSVIQKISIIPQDEFGFTNLGDALDKATIELNSKRHNVEAKRIIVAITDGLSNYPEDPGGEVYAEEKAAQAKSSGITIYTIGLGDSVNAEFLAGKIASGRQRYYAAPERTDLIRIYNEIAQAVCPEKTYLITIYPRVNTVAE